MVIGYSDLSSFTATLACTLEEALRLLSSKAEHGICDVLVYSWPQVWGDTSCGFGGIAGQAMTQAQTVVVVSNVTGSAIVFHAGRLAYTVRCPSRRFWECVAAHHLPGATDPGRFALEGRQNRSPISG